MSVSGEIRQALADAVAAVSGLQTLGYIIENPTPPCAMVYQGAIGYDLSAGRGSDSRPMVVRVIVPFGSDIASQMLLDEFRDPSGPRSFKAALEADKTLGGACQTLRVRSCTADTVYGNSLGKPIGIGCEFQIDLIASGTT